MGTVHEVTMEESMKLQQELVDFYCELDTNSICRMCLEKNQPTKRMYNIFEETKTELVNMIMSCASVQLLIGDGLPTMICNKCFGKLNVAWQFKQQCETSDAKLRQFFSSQVNLSNGIDFSINVVKVTLDDTAAKEQTIEFNYDSETTENMLTYKSECNETKTSTPKRSRRSEKSKGSKSHQCDTCGKIFTRKEYLTQHIRIHTGEKPYQCQQCDKRFVNSGHLTTHMRTHTGEKPHACKLCSKAFSTKQELHKHTMVHNGERPFVCKMCGKSFGSSSNLYSHFKHHTGEKNFTCEQCGKAFYTKQELKQHNVVHTGEKAYVCDLCNKRFSQTAHLRRHSKLHKNG